MSKATIPRMSNMGKPLRIMPRPCSARDRVPMVQEDLRVLSWVGPGLLQDPNAILGLFFVFSGRQTERPDDGKQKFGTLRSDCDGRPNRSAQFRTTWCFPHCCGSRLSHASNVARPVSQTVRLFRGRAWPRAEDKREGYVHKCGPKYKKVL